MKKPNILLVLVDTAQMKSLQLYGGPARMPHVENLAREGMCFTNAFTAIPVCHPTRTCIFTGLYTRGHGVITNQSVTNHFPYKNNKKDFAWYPFKVRNEIQCLAELLGGSGYRCGYAGRWHVDTKGFHDILSFAKYKEHVRNQGVQEKFETDFKICGRTNVKREDTLDGCLAGFGVQLLEQYARNEEPWFIECDLDLPHPPHYIPAPYDTMYPKEQIRLPDNLHDSFNNKPEAIKLALTRMVARSNIKAEDWSDDLWRIFLSHYYGNITMGDDLIGIVLNKLNELGMAQNTVVIFASDHGGAAGQRGFYLHGYPGLYDELLRIPLVIRWPGRIQPGTKNDEFISNTDFLPTILDIAGIDCPQVHGRSFSRFLMGEKINDWPPFAASSYDGDGYTFYTMRAVRDRRYKLIYHAHSISELYDLEKDPMELQNKFYDAAYLPVRNRLIDQLKAHLLRTSDSVLFALEKQFARE